MAKSFQSLIQGVKNPDIAHAEQKPLLSQRLGSAEHYYRGRSLARLVDARNQSAAAFQRLPAPAGPQPQAATLERLPAPAAGTRASGQAPEASIQLLAQPMKRAGSTAIDVNPANAAVGPRMPAEAPAIVGGPARMMEPPSATDAAIARMNALKANAPAVPPPPSMNEGKVGLAALPSDQQAAERVAYGMKMPNMTFSGRPTNPYAEQQIGTRSSGQILSDANGGRRLAATQTLEQAAADPNFNADGRFFQGAKLGMDRNGKAFFREGDKAPQFARGAANAEEARGNYIKGLAKMEVGGDGRIVQTAQGRAFVGAGAQDLTPSQVASRLKAGGTTPSNLTADELAANKASMLARLGARREQAQTMRAENQRQEAIARANQPSPLMQRMMQENPELAVRMMALQQQGQIAQGQLGVQQQELAQRGQLGQAEIGVRQKGIDANVQMKKDELAAAEAQLGRKMTHDEKLQLADQKAAAERQAAQNKAAADLQQNNPLIPIEKERNAALARQAEAQNDLGRERLKAEERMAGAEGQAKVQQGVVGAILADESVPLGERLQLAHLAGTQGLAALQNSPVVARLTGGGKTFAGNTLNQKQFDEVSKMDDPILMRDKLRSYGLKDDEVTVALNALMPPSWMMRMDQGGGNTRSAEDPGGWGNMWRDQYFDPKTGKPLKPQGAISLFR